MNENKLIYISIAELYPHPDNPRKELGDLTELADSIKSKGVMQNLTVVPRSEGGYTVIIGHRRLSAAKLAGMTELPCAVVEMSEKDQLATMLLENMQRVDLTPFEQAQGFQMMFNLGESVENIADKTGFSKATVRRRLKMAELDQNILKEVSGRQISLDDFDKLAQIEDISVRNTLLSDIGTANFNQRVSYNIRKQTVEKMLPLVKAEIKRMKANKLNYSDTYNGKYESLTNYIYLYEWDGKSPLVTENGEKLYYYLDETQYVKFYKASPKKAVKKRPQAEIDREKYVKQVQEQLAELTKDMYFLRKEFIEGLTCTSKNIEQVLRGAVLSCANGVLSGRYGISPEGVYNALGVERVDRYDAYEDNCSKVYNAILAGDKKSFIKVIYTSFGDRADKGYFRVTFSTDFPEYHKNLNMDILYEWLISLGYELSDEEKALRDGTHELFVDKDAKEGERE